MLKDSLNIGDSIFISESVIGSEGVHDAGCAHLGVLTRKQPSSPTNPHFSWALACLRIHQIVGQVRERVAQNATSFIGSAAFIVNTRMSVGVALV